MLTRALTITARKIQSLAGRTRTRENFKRNTSLMNLPVLRTIVIMIL